MEPARQTDTQLVVFDYSGTLSLEAVRFGDAKALGRQLVKSGLSELGIDTPDRYWHDVVMPTWPEASTGRTGFKSIAGERIKTLQLPGATSQAIAAAVSDFVNDYMHRSVIDDRWRPLLADIQALPGTTGLIATDHYAEATAAVCSHLAALGIGSVPFGCKKGPAEKNAFIVANSADIGYLKSDHRFWLAVKRTVCKGPVKQLLLVDDFGSNESGDSDYAATDEIAERIKATRQALNDVFGIEPQILHFMCGENLAGAIADTLTTIGKMLLK